MRSQSIMTALKLGTALAALAAVTPAYAQSSNEPTQGAGEEQEAALANEQNEAAQAGQAGVNNDIVVTARRRAETLQDVPIAITAFSAEQLENSGALDITDIAATTPNVSLEVSRGTNSTLSAFIRGVGQQDPVAGFEAGVGIYLDDVYLNRPQAAVLDIYDVERIEVLRGPQGTLYGRNTIGGAVKYVTRRLPDEVRIRARANIGTYDQADLIVGGSAPVGNGTLRLGATGARLSRGGFGTNLTTGRENYNRDIWAGRITAEVNNEDNVFFRVSGDYTQDNSNPRGGHRLTAALGTGAPVLSNVFDTRGGLNDLEQEVEAWGVTGFGEIQPTENITLRSITAYRQDESSTPIDFDALPQVDLDVPAIYENQQFSQELQILYNSGPINALLGGYYLDANARTIFDVRLPATAVALTFGDVETETFAIFGDVTFDVTDQLSLSFGGRYTWDRRTSDILRQVFILGTSPGSPFFGGNGSLFRTDSDFEGTANFEEFTPRASITYEINDDQTVYASYSRGFKGGGFDPRGVSVACRNPTGGACNADQLFDFMSFDPETVTSYELGYRASLFDRRLSFSLNAFHADYSDVQVPGSVGTTIGGQQTFIGVTTNAGRARFQGIEFEGNLAIAQDFGTPGDRLGLSWSLGYLNADYLEFIDARGINVADNRRIQNTPEWTASGTLTYSTPVAGGNLNASTTLGYRSSSQQFELSTPLLDQGAFALLDANLVWRSDDDRFTIGLHGRNLTDKRYIVSGYNFFNQDPDTGIFEGRCTATPGRIPCNQPGLDPTLGSQGTLTGFYGNPRTVFLSLGVNF